MKALTLITLTLSFLFVHIGYAQTDSLNLVPNGSFEEYDKIPSYENQLMYSRHWKSPLNSSDYFHIKSNKFTGRVGVPENFTGNQYPKKGKAYAGIVIFNDNYGFKEYLQVRLKKTLLVNKTYKIKFYLSVAENSYYGCHNLISFSLTDTNIIQKYKPFNTYQFKKYEDRKGFYMLDYQNHITINFDTLYSNQDSLLSKWIEINYNYKAKGGEKYLTIGMFKNDISKWKYFIHKYFKKRINKYSLENGLYYYIDEVSITPLPCI